MRKALLLTATLALLTAILALFASVVSADRLPASVVPTHYTLWFAPDLKAATFRGRETIEVTVVNPSTAITLNAAEIDFGEVTIAAGGQSQTARVTLDAKNETATLKVARTIPKGPASIQITYNGILNDKLRGFYLSTANGRRYAVSQMEATDARRAFPSWDEPAYKATFDISMTIDAGDTAISNGAEMSDTPGPEAGKHTVAFARTQKMSAYLVALLVGDFACRDGSSDGIALRVCSTPDKRALTGFALEAAEQQVRFYNEWTGIKYPFGKLDLIGVPDFSAGAMENAGAITFREEALLADQEHASLETRKQVASTISHEIAHQWFGDLVTMKWWDDIWLNEGFATWMANKPLAVWRPDWQVDLDVVEEAQVAVSTDALRATRPVRTRVETPDEINEVFDRIAYEKTASILRSIETYVGPDLMRTAVRSYLQHHAFSNASGEDFWTEVARVTGKPVDRVMKPYVEQPGVPLVSVTSAECRGNTTDVRLHQERFIGAPGENSTTPASQLWAIPVCFKSAPNGESQCTLLDKREATITLSACVAHPFGNANGSGYYLTEYSPDYVRSLGQNARTSLAPSERLNLLGSEWWMVRAGRHDVGVYLDLASSLVSDDVPSVVEQIGRSLDYVGDYVVAPADAERFQTWVRSHVTPELETLGLPGNLSDGADQQSRRATLLTIAGTVGNSPDVQQRARALALQYIADPTSLAPELASAVLTVAAQGGDAALYDRYMAELPKLSGRPEDYYRVFYALPEFRDQALVQRTLKFAVSPDVRTQDTAALIGGLIRQPASRDTAWAFVKENWETLTRTLGIFQGLPRIVGSVGAFCSSEKSAEVQAFFKAHPVPGADRVLAQAVERMDNCAAVKARQQATASSWLTSAAR